MGSVGGGCVSGAVIPGVGATEGDGDGASARVPRGIIVGPAVRGLYAVSRRMLVGFGVAIASVGIGVAAVFVV